jgi:two-component system phosphate regulon sensor histidine kinase PhoR
MLKLITVGAKVDLHDENIDPVLDHLQVYTADILHKREQSLLIESNHPSYRMDHDLMLSLLINLIDNASKASDPGQTIVIKATGNEITIMDQGTGISSEDLLRITEPFYTADKSRSKKLSGNGIGLALAQEIATTHNAKLVFESELGVGTTAKLIFE